MLVWCVLSFVCALRTALACTIFFVFSSLFRGHWHFHFFSFLIGISYGKRTKKIFFKWNNTKSMEHISFARFEKEPRRQNSMKDCQIGRQSFQNRINKGKTICVVFRNKQNSIKSQGKSFLQRFTQNSIPKELEMKEEHKKCSANNESKKKN